MYARLSRRAALVLAAALCSAPLFAQQPVSIRAIDPSTFASVMFGDATNNASRVVQVPGTQAATNYWTIRLSDGTNYLTPATDYVHDAAITIGSATGPLIVGRASAATPSAVSADNDAAAVWVDRTGAIVSAVGASASAGIAASECIITSAASTNATNCKASAGNWYGYDLINTTTTTYYLRLYNLATSPTCSSATGFIRSIPIPPASAAGGAGGAIRITTVPIAYATGIAFCLTGGAASTDNTNAATGIYGAMVLK